MHILEVGSAIDFDFKLKGFNSYSLDHAFEKQDTNK